jgi:hypothetical protein
MSLLGTLRRFLELCGWEILFQEPAGGVVTTRLPSSRYWGTLHGDASGLGLALLEMGLIKRVPND